MSATDRLEAIVRGRVQGVGYRYFVLDRALDLGVSGWVANESDGSVRCRAEGTRVPSSACSTRSARVRRAPGVDRIETTWSVGTGDLGRFQVRSGGHRGD